MKIHQLTNLEASSMATTQIEHGYHHLTASEIASVSANSPNPSAPALFHVSFNYNSSCFAVGTDRGYRLYSCDPFREIFRRSSGGIGVFEILLHSNILALVGGGPDPHCPANRVMLVDDSQRRTIGQLCYRAEVRGVRLRRDRIVVVLEQNVFVYNYADMRRLHHFTTVENPKGLCEVSHAAGANMVLACPGLYKGQVRVERYGFCKRTRLIMAHDNGIACLAINQDGSLLATSSTKGTLVRVFNTLDGTLLQEVRRGADRAEIYSMAFSPTAPWLAVSSDKGTVHVFSLKINSPNPSNESSSTGTEANNLHSQFEASLSFIKGVLPKYFSSERSMARFRLSERSRCVVTFGHQKNTVVILGMDGSFYRCKFDPVKGGQMIQLEHHNFLAQNQSQLDS